MRFSLRARSVATRGLSLASVLIASTFLTGAAVPGRPAPALNATSARGVRVNLAGLRGSVVVVDFCASWCVPCRAEVPFLDGLSQRFAARGLVVLAVSVDEVPEHFAAFNHELRPTFAMIHDAQHTIVEAWSPESLPDTFVVDRSGTVIAEHRGYTAQGAASLEREVIAALARSE